MIEGHISVRTLWKCRTTLCYMCTSTIKYKAYVYVVCGFSCVLHWILGFLYCSTYQFILCPDFKYEILKVNFWQLTTFTYDPIPSLTQVNYSLGAGYFTNVNSFYTFLITPWDRVLLVKPTGSQLVNKFSAFYGTWRFITTFTNARHLSLSWARSVQSIPPHPTAWRSILILSSHVHLGTELRVQTVFIRSDKYELLQSLICIQHNILIGIFLQRAVHVTLLLQIFVNPYGNSIQAQHKYKHQTWEQESVLTITQLKAVLNS